MNQKTLDRAITLNCEIETLKATILVVESGQHELVSFCEFEQKIALSAFQEALKKKEEELESL